MEFVNLALLVIVLVAFQGTNADDSEKEAHKTALHRLRCRDHWDCKRCGEIKKRNQCNKLYFSGVCYKTCTGCGPYVDKVANCSAIAKQGKCFVRETVSPFVTPATRCEKSCCTGIIPLPTPTTPPLPYWGKWTQWSACSKSCAGGYRMRRRICHTGNSSRRYCEGFSHDFQNCNSYIPCFKVNGGWTEWSEWSSCQSTCGFGKKLRTRSCSNPWPQNGGRNCEGTSEEAAKCYSGCCPEAGSWSSWSAWSPCSKTCSSDGSSGISERRRSCTNPRPFCGGPLCKGSHKQRKYCSSSVPCSTAAPSQPPTWSNWGAWGPCTKTCSYGYKLRKRTCLNKRKNGRDCDGYSTEYDWCNMDVSCP